jgi:hypothetical protein
LVRRAAAEAQGCSPSLVPAHLPSLGNEGIRAKEDRKNPDAEQRDSTSSFPSRSLIAVKTRATVICALRFLSASSCSRFRTSRGAVPSTLSMSSSVRTHTGSAAGRVDGHEVNGDVLRRCARWRRFTMGMR